MNELIYSAMIFAIGLSGGLMLLAIISETLAKYFPDAD
jgi:hypothetical protein